MNIWTKIIQKLKLHQICLKIYTQGTISRLLNTNQTQTSYDFVFKNEMGQMSLFKSNGFIFSTKANLKGNKIEYNNNILNFKPKI